MKYVNAIEVIPEELLLEIQKYVSGDLIYIPKVENKRKSWGEVSGIRKEIASRNTEIKEKFRDGSTINQLVSEYCLAYETIKKIVYTRN